MYAPASLRQAASGVQIASGGEDAWAHVWEPGASNPRLSLSHAGKINAVAWSPTGRWLAIAGGRAIVQVWNVKERGNAPLICRGHTAAVYALAFSPDGTFLASASADATVRVWQMPTGACVYTYLLHTDAVLALAWSPDGTYLASGGRDQTLHIWHPTDGTTAFSGQCALSLHALAWSPNGRWLAYGCQSGGMGRDRLF
jgi:WD40 repeat protein